MRFINLTRKIARKMNEAASSVESEVKTRFATVVEMLLKL
jgi:hypothetical protein